MDTQDLMQLSYDQNVDVLYLSMGEPRHAISREIGDDLLLRVDAETGEIVGLTILNLSSRTDESLPLSMTLREKF